MPCQAGTLHHHPLTLISDMSAPPPPPPRRNSWRVYERVGLRNSLLCLTNTTRFLSLFHFAVVFTHCCTSLGTRISSRRNVLPSERSRTAAEELLPRRETLISSIAAHSNSFASPLFFADYFVLKYEEINSQEALLQPPLGTRNNPDHGHTRGFAKTADRNGTPGRRRIKTAVEKRLAFFFLLAPEKRTRRRRRRSERTRTNR